MGHDVIMCEFNCVVKICHVICNIEDQDKLQSDINRVREWANK